MFKLFTHLRTYWAISVVLLVFVISAYKVFTYREAPQSPGTITLRIGHWQLESGVREAFEEMANQYRIQVNPNVRIIQDAIPETIYGQWITSQMMGRTAPDLIECGLGVPPNIWLGYYNRYCLPLSSLANRPNPHNANTEFHNTPLRQTFVDGLRAGYINEMGQYMVIPLSQFNSRVFVNLDLLKQLTGSDVPPKDFHSFKRACHLIRSKQYAPGKPYVPIVGSTYHFGLWQTMLAEPLTYNLLKKADFNRDGAVATDETYIAFKTGLLSFDAPELAARFKMIAEIASFCQSGFTGLTRDEGMFLFAQGRAVFMSSGSWDAASIFDQAAGKFTVGVCPFPFPTQDDPDYGRFVSGPAYEPSLLGVPMAVTRFSKHPEIAKDFLLFMASKQQNARFNEIAGWIPTIKNAPIPTRLTGFTPRMEGMYPAFSPLIGGDTINRWNQLSAQFLIGQLSYPDFAKQFTSFYLEQGAKDLIEQNRDWRRTVLVTEQSLASIRSSAMLQSDPAAAANNWIKYRTVFTDRIIFSDTWHNATTRFINGQVQPTAAPYEYTPEVLSIIRARLKAQAHPHAPASSLSSPLAQPSVSANQPTAPAGAP